MKLAYIITAYKDAPQLLRLVKSLDCQADFYCHIDKKTNIRPFKKLLDNYPNVHFAKNRYFVNWGSFAQVLSQKELMGMVINSGKNYDRVICLSGLDYPILSNQRIFDFFEKNRTKEFICGVNISDPVNSMLHDRVKVYHYFRDIRVRSVYLKKFFSGTSRIIMKMLPYRKTAGTSIGGKPADIYMGSDYWALTSPCARYVFDTMLNEKTLMRYFRHSFVPSEMCVQTIVFNSGFANQAIKSSVYCGLPALTPLHYIVYSKEIKIFDELDYETLTICGKLFFRKAVTGKSDKLMELIDIFRSMQEDIVMRNTPEESRDSVVRGK
ncbi:MAG TPA: beta-1,6-N-acetylglucosaminyltransferase [Paludibacter sp.]|nr:beta-1,6-N-acetylglucosaminyltransferase [Paludibacter sp.]